MYQSWIYVLSALIWKNQHNVKTVSVVWLLAKLVSLFARNNGHDRLTLNKLISTLIRGLLIMICLTFLYIAFFHIFLKVPMLSTRFSHPKVTTPPKQRASESSVSGRVLNPKVTRVVTFGTLRNSAKKRYYGLIPLGGFILLEFSSALICERRGAYGFAVTRFCSNLHFTCKLRYCGYTKPSGLRDLEIFG